MSDKKLTIDDIEVSDGMYEAAMDAAHPALENGLEATAIGNAIAAALLYLAEHPIMPTDGFLIEMLRQERFSEGQNWNDHQVFLFCKEWQSSMFLKSVPELPEELKELLCDESVCDTSTGRRSTYNKALIAAYELGKKATHDPR